MENDNAKSKKFLLVLLIAIAVAILIAVGSTFAYFSTAISSDPNAVSARAAEFRIGLEDDTSLIKSNIIPSDEVFVDAATKGFGGLPARVDANTGEFLKPYEDNEQNLVTAGTACIDDNLNEICSIYTFTIINELTDTDIPLYVTLSPSVNTFENLYFKVLDSELNVVISKTHLVDDREYTLDANDERVYAEGATISPVVLTNLNTTLPKATDSQTPSTVTYSIIMWIDENNHNQNDTDGGKIFASTLNISASGANGGGITGVISASGIENNGG